MKNDNTIRNVSIIGTGSYLPERVLTNADLEKMVDTTDEWIYTRTGIRERRIAREDQPVSDMAKEASKKALSNANIRPDEVGMIVVATTTPDMMLPNTACLVQDLIGAKNAFCLDVSAACAGFLYGLEVAHTFIASGNIDTALVIGSDKMSCITDWQDRSTCVLFGDGAGAAVLQARDGTRGIMRTLLGSNGSLADLLKIPAGGSRKTASVQTVKDRSHYIKMEGREVFKHAVTCMTNAAQQILDHCGLTIQDVNCIIPHQANARIIKAIGQQINAPLETFYINVEKYGNTSAASIIVAMDEASQDHRIKTGDLVLLVGFGGGFSWGASLIEWCR
ncbi:MAG: beta-ketoacyl-ACP synthase III [Kiritimatiellae bacterium]|nr:beta-ketoacyl-ACP synthase III [Kiritimatiellia bacterium]